MQLALPLGADEAAALLEPLASGERVLLAVSGGPDSVALMHLAHRAAVLGALPHLVVATVDHGLQSQSAKVAQDVVAQARTIGIEAHVLSWVGAKPSTGLQEAAREARYALLCGLAADIGASHLVTAHTLDDQAETILFRMARGSGPAGLIGMRAAVRRQGVIHLRPFLGIAKDRLVATCRQQSWCFVEDPANQDPRFARSRIRALLPLLASEGLDAGTLAILAARLASSEAAIGTMAESLRRRVALPAEAGRMAYDAGLLFVEPRAVVIALLQRALSDFSHPGPPRLGRLEALVDEFDQAFRRGQALARTLHGTLVTLFDGSRLELVAEPQRRRGRGANGNPEIAAQP